MIPQISSPFGVTSGSLLSPKLFQAPQFSIDQPSAGQPDFTTAPVNTNNGVLGAIQSVLQMVGLMASSATGPANFDLTGGSVARPGGAAQSNAAVNSTRNPLQKGRLDDTLNAISQDPEGSKLLEAAKAKGYTIEVGDPSEAAGGALDKGHAGCSQCQAAFDGGQQINGVTLPSEKKIVIDPNAPDFEKTVVHELVHAASDDDDNSQQEEGIADVIGYRVAGRITGEAQPGNARSIYQNKMANYQELNGSNSIRNTLAGLGISAGV